MAHIENALLWLTVFIYVAAFCLQLFAFVRGRDSGFTVAMRLLCLAGIAHSVTLVARWVAGGHPPVADTYELNLTGTWFTMAIFLGFTWARKIPRIVGLVVTPVTFLVLGYGALCRTDAAPLGPAYDSPWLIVHVVFAWLAFGCFAVSAGAAAMLLVKAKAPQWPPAGKIPPVEDLDQTSYRFIVLGFINHAVMLVTGAIWAQNLWGHYWSWDPLETWSLLTFLFYAFYLHTRSFLGWKMSRAAWMAAFGLIVLSISFWGVTWFGPSLHPGP